MIGDPSPYSDTDRSDFPLCDPDAGPGRPPLALQTEAFESPDSCHLNIAQVTVHIFSQLGSEIYEGIDDQLARTVIGDISTAACPINRHLSWRKNVGHLTTPADGEDMWMLDQKEDIRKPLPLLRPHEPLLERKGLEVIHLTQLFKKERRHALAPLLGKGVRRIAVKYFGAFHESLG